VKLVLISDTHTRHEGVDVPPGDVLIHAGDITGSGGLKAVEHFAAWFERQPHPHKVVIAGNHDFCFERTPAEAEALLSFATYLRDSETTIDGVRFWGSPWQPWFMDWAFNLQRGAEIRAKWDLIPDGIDVLITHGPPRGHGDLMVSGEHVGCDDLLDALRRVKPRLHVFGHIHEGYGTSHEGETTCVNASTCDVGYRPVNAPVVVDV